jgi:hypothetical protein
MSPTCGDVQGQPVWLRLRHLDQSFQILALGMRLAGHVALSKVSKSCARIIFLLSFFMGF